LPTTGLRFFTVYGPWGRPDMALFKFTDLIIKNKPIPVFNYGKMKRDFTYIDDVIESIFLLMKKPPKISSNKNSSNITAPYIIFNVGNSKPIDLMMYINAIENILGKKANIKFEEMQPGDVETTYANTEALNNWINFRPSTPINLGVKKFIEWYLEYYK
jgi:UDP-glucuronate 4-epimerase